jgi:hypothetical protein
MKYPTLIPILFAAATFAQESNLDALLSELARNPRASSKDGEVLIRLERQPSDPRIVPALEAAFDKATDKKTKQYVAQTLVHIGGPDRYYEYLAGFARAAVASDMPAPFNIGKDGNGAIVTNPECEAWAKGHDMDIETALKVALYDLMEDVSFLAKARDKRANAIFRDGLNSHLLGVVTYSAEGLALLQDVSAIPLVIAACERMKGSAQMMVAGQLAKFQNPDADRAMERFITNEVSRKNIRREAQLIWTGELRNQAMRNTGKTAK